MARPAKPKVEPQPKAPKVPKPSSIATLGKRAKEGDAEALRELVARTASDDPEVVTGAATAIAAVATREAHEILIKVGLESPNSALRFTALRAIDKALKKHDWVLELVIELCTDPRVDNDDYPMSLLSNLVSKTPSLAEDPRVIGALRRAIHAKHPYAQDSAVSTLRRIKDVASLPQIVALLDRDDRSNSLWMWIGEAVLELGGGAAELAKLEAARPRARPTEIAALDRCIETLRGRLAGAG
jgi:HEAT repeat protein